jgi:hypothetical protein
VLKVKTTLSAADFWELRCRSLEANAAIRELKARALAIESERDAFVDGLAVRYGFDGRRPFTLDDVDLSLTQAELRIA